MPTTDPFRTGTDKMKPLRNKADVAQRQLPIDFLDNALEWRRIIAEAWGMFLLVVVAAGGEVVAARSGGAVTPGLRAVAPGLMVMAIIYFMGAVSGAHLNPAVTLAFAVRRNFPWRRVSGYVLGQVVGGVLAALFLRHVRHDRRAWGDSARQWHRQRKSLGDGSAADNWVGEHNPRHGLRSTQHRHQRCYRGRWIYCPGRTLGSANQRCLDEPGEIVCAGFGARELRHDVDLRGRPGHRRANRGHFRVDSQGQALSCRRDCSARCARRR